MRVYFVQLVKEKQAATDVMFDPLHDIIDLLRDYGVVIPEESMVQLQELPEKWGNTKRLSVMAKQQVNTLQSLTVVEQHYVHFTGHFRFPRCKPWRWGN